MTRLLLFVLCAAPVSSIKLLMVLNGPQRVGPGSTLAEVDLAAKTSRNMLPGGLEKPPANGNSVVCGNVWYGEMNAYFEMPGIAMVDISQPSGKLIGVANLSSVPASGSQPSFHNKFSPLLLKCGHQFGELFAIGMNGADDSDNTTYVRYLTNLTSPTGPTSSLVGSVPHTGCGGYNGEFRFAENSVYMHCYDEMIKMDLVSGKVAARKKYVGTNPTSATDVLIPEFILPGDEKFTGIFCKKFDDSNFCLAHYFCHVDASGSDAKISKCSDYKLPNMPGALWSPREMEGIPIQCAGDEKYYFAVLSSCGLSEECNYTIFGVDMNTSETIEVFRFPSKQNSWHVGTWSCSEGSGARYRVFV